MRKKPMTDAEWVTLDLILMRLGFKITGWMNKTYWIGKHITFIRSGLAPCTEVFLTREIQDELAFLTLPWGVP